MDLIVLINVHVQIVTDLQALVIAMEQNVIMVIILTRFYETQKNQEV